MRFNRSWTATLLIAMGLIVGCGSDPVAPGGGTGVALVIVTPGSATLSSVGQDLQFAASAFDGLGSAVDVPFSWQTSDSQVVSIDPSGLALAMGLGSAEIIVTTSGISDTALVKVVNSGAPLVNWIAAGDGNWQTATNWSTGVVPGADDVAVIDAPGTYTVTMTGDVSVRGVVLGSDIGIQTLATGANTLRTETGGLQRGADLHIIQSGAFEILGEFVWSGGTVRGTSASNHGLVRINPGAELYIIGNPLDLSVETRNQGKIALLAGSLLRLRMGVRGLTTDVGSIVELHHDASLSVEPSAVFTSNGLLIKTDGMEDATIFSSQGTFLASGGTYVDAGGLRVSGGTLKGVVNIFEGTTLRLSGTTSIPSIISRGRGALEIGGRVTFGSPSNQSISLQHLILDSGNTDALTGPATIRVDRAFTWRRGRISSLGQLITMSACKVSFETSATKVISGTKWTVFGEVAGNSSSALTMTDRAEIDVTPQGRWHQDGGATISQGQNSPIGFTVGGEFHKVGNGAFVVETPFTCSGTLNLAGGSLTAQGAFAVSRTGVITGGSKGTTGIDARLTVVGAPSAEMLGTIRPELDGAAAYMVINGNLTLATTSRIEVDVPVNGPIPIETVSFTRGGQALGGTLAINLLVSPGNGEWRAVSTISGTGSFDEITGVTAFDVIEDDRGVLLRR